MAPSPASSDSSDAFDERARHPYGRNVGDAAVIVLARQRASDLFGTSTILYQVATYCDPRAQYALIRTNKHAFHEVVPLIYRKIHLGDVYTMETHACDSARKAFYHQFIRHLDIGGCLPAMTQRRSSCYTLLEAFSAANTLSWTHGRVYRNDNGDWARHHIIEPSTHHCANAKGKRRYYKPNARPMKISFYDAFDFSETATYDLRLRPGSSLDLDDVDALADTDDDCVCNFVNATSLFSRRYDTLEILDASSDISINIEEFVTHFKSRAAAKIPPYRRIVWHTAEPIRDCNQYKRFVNALAKHNRLVEAVELSVHHSMKRAPCPIAALADPAWHRLPALRSLSLGVQLQTDFPLPQLSIRPECQEQVFSLCRSDCEWAGLAGVAEIGHIRLVVGVERFDADSGPPRMPDALCMAELLTGLGSPTVHVEIESAVGIGRRAALMVDVMRRGIMEHLDMLDN